MPLQRFVAALLLFSCAAVPALAREKQHGLGVVSLDVCGDGARLHLLIAERDASSTAPQLRYFRSEDAGETWAAPVPVGTGQPPPQPAHRGLDAQIAASGQRLVAVWTTGAQTRFGRGPLATAISHDGGRTWKPGPNPSDDGLNTDHAFADIAADEQGTFHLVWLDGRAGENSGKGLRYARSTDGGKSWSANITLDEQCCECCWNSILTTRDGGVHVLYRDRDPRDMALVSSADRGRTWNRAGSVGAFNWDFTGCPHVGGALAAGKEAGELHAVVWTAKGGPDVGAFVLSSSNAGRSWESPSRLGGPQSSRPDLAASHTKVAAAWDEYIDGGDSTSGNAAFAGISVDGGKTWSAAIRLSATGAPATYPRLVALPSGFRVFWTQKSHGKAAEWVSRKLD